MVRSSIFRLSAVGVRPISADTINRELQTRMDVTIEDWLSLPDHFLPCRIQYSRKERNRGNDSRSFCRFVAALPAIMSSMWQT